MKRLQLTGRRRVALVVAGNVVLLLLGWFLLIAPQRNQGARAAAELGATQAAIERAQAPAPARAAGAQPVQPAIRTADLYRLAKAMPSTADMPDLLLELDQVSRAAGVSVVSIAPATAVPDNGFDVLPLSLTFSGDFYSLTDLLYRLQRLVDVRHGALDARGRLFSVSSVALTPSGKGKTLTATATLDAYVYAPALTGSATGAASTGTTSTGTTGTTTTTTTSRPNGA